jgi:hypothetical protein
MISQGFDQSEADGDGAEVLVDGVGEGASRGRPPSDAANRTGVVHPVVVIYEVGMNA